jgi:riboflavin biosynthesis pyrimidine reductase
MTDVCDVVGCGSDEVDLAQGIRSLAERGLGRIHCEGGPSLLADLAKSDLLDEIALSLSPKLAGAPSREHLLPIPGGLQSPRRWNLLHAFEEDGTTFLRVGRP